MALSKEEILDAISEMSVMDVVDLVKMMEDKFGVSAAAPVAAAAPAAADSGAEAAEEKSEFEIFLADVGDKKIDVIKAVRTITGLGLKEAKAIVDGAPASVKEGANKEEAEKWLRAECRLSDFPLRTGLHIEKRPGMVNFSVVGRNANQEQRKQYYYYDCKTKEREQIAKAFNEKFPKLQADVGGETGIDIFPYGKDKAQIVNDFNEFEDTLHFFGDRMDRAGNDYPLKRVILDNDLGMCYSVSDWKHTWKLLKEYD